MFGDGFPGDFALSMNRILVGSHVMLSQDTKRMFWIGYGSYQIGRTAIHELTAVPLRSTAVYVPVELRTRNMGLAIATMCSVAQKDQVKLPLFSELPNVFASLDLIIHEVYEVSCKYVLEGDPTVHSALLFIIGARTPREINLYISKRLNDQVAADKSVKLGVVLPENIQGAAAFHWLYAISNMLGIQIADNVCAVLRAFEPTLQPVTP